MPESPFAMCCFCGGHVLRTEAVTVTVRHQRYTAVQNMWAHPEHLQQAVEPSGIEIVVYAELLGNEPSRGVLDSVSPPVAGDPGQAS